MSCSNFSPGVGDRWEELHRLASEPREQHVLMAEQVEDATNGFLSTLSKSAVCTVASPGKAFQARREWSCPGGSGVGMVPWGKRSGGSPGRGKARGMGSGNFGAGVPCSIYFPVSGPVGFLRWEPGLSLWVRGVQALGPRSREALCLSTSSGRRAESAFWSWSAQGHFSWGGGLCIPSCHCHGLTRRTLRERYTCA